MTIFDEIAALGSARGFHGTAHERTRALCRVSMIPHAWCKGCRDGVHRHVVAQVVEFDATPLALVMNVVDEAREGPTEEARSC